MDETAHVEQISVHPDFGRQGLGRALLDTAAAWAARRGLTALTLTTFTDVPWNAPYYARLGFRVVTEDEWTRVFDASASMKLPSASTRGPGL